MKRQQKNSLTISKTGQSNELIDKALSVIRQYTDGKQAVVAFSGGMDSTLALLLAKEVIPNITAVHIDWGDFTYPTIRKKVKSIVKHFHIPLHVIYGDEALKQLAHRGISCNTCTRHIKLGTIKQYYPNTVIITGANQSDSWGKGGTYFNPPFLAPLKDFTKDEEMKILKNIYGITDFHIGIHPEREGCMLRHLWMPDRDGTKTLLTATVNQKLLDFLDSHGISHYLANVKVIGNKRGTKLIVNVLPTLPQETKEKIDHLLSPYGPVLWGDTLSSLTAVINPSLDNQRGKESLRAIILGELASHDADITFIRSKSDFIRLFQVVDAL